MIKRVLMATAGCLRQCKYYKENTGRMEECDGVGVNVPVLIGDRHLHEAA